MDKAERTFMGALPPLNVTASGQSKVNVSYQVRVVIEVREHDTLRRWAEQIAGCCKRKVTA